MGPMDPERITPVIQYAVLIESIVPMALTTPVMETIVSLPIGETTEVDVSGAVWFLYHSGIVMVPEKTRLDQCFEPGVEGGGFESFLRGLPLLASLVQQALSSFLSFLGCT